MGIRLYIYCALLCSSLFASQSIFNIHLSHQLETVSDHNSNEEYHIAFLLPFCVDNNEILFSGDLDSLMVDVDFLENYQFYKKTKISIDFFLGFLLSIDEFPGIDIKISLYDIQEGDMSKRVLRTILNEGDLDDVDLVVGPLFTDNVVFFSKRFRRSIPIISPFSKKSHITSYNNNVFQVPVDIMDQLSVFANQLFSAHQYDNILLLKRDTILDTLYRKIDGLEEYELTIDTIIPSDIAYGDIFLDVANNILSDTLQSMCFEEVKVSASIIDSIYHKYIFQFLYTIISFKRIYNGSYLISSIKTIRTIRLIRIFRILKLIRYVKEAKALKEAFANKSFACSFSEIPWKDWGLESLKLDYLGFRYGLFHDGHRARTDVDMLLSILSQNCPSSDFSVLSTLLEYARQITYRIFAKGLPFEKKEFVKARGYRWSDGKNGSPRAWWIDTIDKTEELDFLSDHGCVSPDVKKYSAKERHRPFE